MFRGEVRAVGTQRARGERKRMSVEGAMLGPDWVAWWTRWGKGLRRAGAEEEPWEVPPLPV